MSLERTNPAAERVTLWRRPQSPIRNNRCGIGQWTGGVGVGDMLGSDVRVSGELCHGECKLNWRSNLPKRKAAQATAEVGGVRSSDDPVPDLWFGELAGERRDATCSAGGRATKNVVTALWAISARKCSRVANPCW